MSDRFSFLFAGVSAIMFINLVRVLAARLPYESIGHRRLRHWRGDPRPSLNTAKQMLLDLSSF